MVYLVLTVAIAAAVFANAAFLNRKMNMSK